MISRVCWSVHRWRDTDWVLMKFWADRERTVSLRLAPTAFLNQPKQDILVQTGVNEELPQISVVVVYQGLLSLYI